VARQRAPYVRDSNSSRSRPSFCLSSCLLRYLPFTLKLLPSVPANISPTAPCPSLSPGLPALPSHSCYTPSPSICHCLCLLPSLLPSPYFTPLLHTGISCLYSSATSAFFCPSGLLVHKSISRRLLPSLLTPLQLHCCFIATTSLARLPSAASLSLRHLISWWCGTCCLLCHCWQAGGGRRWTCGWLSLTRRDSAYLPACPTHLHTPAPYPPYLLPPTLHAGAPASFLSAVSSTWFRAICLRMCWRGNRDHAGTSALGSTYAATACAMV